MKDAFTKEKFWIYTISYEHEDGSLFDETVQLSANDTTILMFRKVNKFLYNSIWHHLQVQSRKLWVIESVVLITFFRK